MTTYSDPSGITGTEDIIRKSDIEERLRNLKPWFIEDRTGKELAVFSSQEEAEAYPHLTSDEIYSNGDEPEEQQALKALLEEWSYPGDFMVSQDYLEEYAQEEADSLTSGAEYLFPYVDWHAVAGAMAADMLEVDFLGSTYYIRN